MFEPERSERVLHPFLRPERRPRHRLRGSGPAGAHLANVGLEQLHFEAEFEPLEKISVLFK